MDILRYSGHTEESIYKEFGSAKNIGLTSQQVSQKINKFGKNLLPHQQISALSVFIRQLKSPFIYLLIIASIITFLLNHHLDGIFILFFVVIDIIFGFFQEYRSEKTIEILNKFHQNKVKVIRNGQPENIDSAELVPGDILQFQAGDTFSADVRIIEAKGLQTDESLLTGESNLVPKNAQIINKNISSVYQARNIGFCATVVSTGSGQAVVLATGKNSKFGQIGQLASTINQASLFEINISKFSNFLLKLILITITLLFFINISIKGGSSNVLELLVFSVALAISVIPEALPLVTTFSLSQGALRMAKKNVVVKRLSAIEDLGSIDILCTDKTGTLTENNLSVEDISSVDPAQTIFYAGLTVLSFKTGMKPLHSFDSAIWAHLSKSSKDRILGYRLLGEMPFDPHRRYNSVTVSKAKHIFHIIRGAPEDVMNCCEQIAGKQRIEEWIKNKGRQGFRTIAIAVKNVSDWKSYHPEKQCRHFQFLGCISFSDPLKKSSISAVEKAKHLGLEIKIISGDSPDVAGAVACQMQLIPTPDDVITGLQLDRLNPIDRESKIKKFQVFARITPEQKYEIINTLKKHHQVGFLGEGINDAPALKTANVGLAVNDASDVAREASDIVLMKKSLLVIVDGIEQGRKIFANIRKYIQATLISNFGNFYAVAVASLLINYLPMLPVQLLLLNLLSDFPMIAIATDNVDRHELKKPKVSNVSEIVLVATFLGIISTIFDFVYFAIFYRSPASVLQTNWFIASVLTELLLIYSIRTKLPFYKSKRPSLLLQILSLGAVFTTVILPFSSIGKEVFHFTPPSQNQLLLILLIAVLYFLITEIVKLLYYRSYQLNEAVTMHSRRN